jgi:membrane fusion protein (multidrug efflux system)
MVNMAVLLRRRAAWLILAVILIGGAAGLYAYVRYAGTRVSTDDAYVTGRIHVVAAKVPGTVKAILVHDNQFVKKGTLLLEIDERDYDVRVNEASSSLHAEEAQTREPATRVEVANSHLTEWGIASHRPGPPEASGGQPPSGRNGPETGERLFAKTIIAQERYEKIKTAYEGARAQEAAAREQLQQAEAALSTQQSLIRQTETAHMAQKAAAKQKGDILTAERLRHSYTRIYAPSDGYVTRKAMEVGNQIQAGQPLMAVVPLDDVWVVANYKETQLARVKAGQKASFTVDSYPGQSFKGKVHSVMAGTGSAFSLFPPENATGNYVKVVQRIPVKIVLEEGADPSHVLRVGMSVVPTIFVE